METLEHVLATEREEAAVLRRNGYKTEADNRERILKRIEAAAEDYLRFVNENDATLHTGRSAAWLRGRFARWAQDGHAEIRRGVRYYRLVALPPRDRGAPRRPRDGS